MVNKTISLTYWTFEKLKDEYNASGLIDRLLREFYKYSDVNKLEEAKLELEKEEERKVKKEKLRVEAVKNIISNVKEIFNIDLNEEQAKDYLDGHYETMKDYIDKHFNGI